MDELGIKMSAMTVINVPYFMNQKSLPQQAKLLQNI